jgi:taurine--2-oxoglutarate transaminase
MQWRGPTMTDERRNVLHSWCVQAEWDAPTVTGGEGAFFRDEHGRRYLDMSSLAECMNLGHQHPAVVRAIREQAERLCFVTAAWGAEPRARLAERLLEKSGFEGGRVFFTLGGADANEHAVKFARQASGKPRGWILTRDRSYHGASYAAMALSGDARVNDQVDARDFHVEHVPPPYAYRCPFGSTSDAECAERSAKNVGEVIDRRGEGAVAAVLMEPNAGTNGIVAPDSYWPRLREETRARGVTLIADEVMSGFGRCGEWFAWQRHGEAGRPDIMTLAKGLTGAHLPLGAVVLSADVAARLEHERLQTGLTYCGHPLSCAAGLAALRAYEDEGLVERSRVLGARMLAELRAMQDRLPVIGDVRGGHGLFAVVELVRDRATREPVAAWPRTHPSLEALVSRGRAEGVSFAVRGNLVLLAPPLVIREEDLRSALALLERLLSALEWS